MKLRRTFIIVLHPAIRAASIGMLKEGLKSPTIARLLNRRQEDIEIHLGWWVNERMQSVQGRTYTAYRAAAATELNVSFQSAMKWHLRYLFSCQVSADSAAIAEATEEYCRQTPNVQHRMREKLKGRADELALLREFGYMK